MTGMVHISIAFDDDSPTIGVFANEDEWLTVTTAIVRHLGSGYAISAYESNWSANWTHRVPLRTARAA